MINPLSVIKDAANALAPGLGDTIVDVAKTAAPIVDQLVPDAGDLLEDVFDAVGMEQLGDFASLLANAGTGNIPAVIGDVVDLFETMPEPGPPPATDGADAGGASRAGSEPIDQAAPAVTSDGAPDAGAPASAAAPAEAAPSDAGGGPARAGESKGKTAAREFMARFDDPEAFLDAIKNGDLPPEVANSQEGMMMIQQRMAEISRMFQMMTQMMDALHQMSMAIVRNIRA
jgi:hypothetical protein